MFEHDMNGQYQYITFLVSMLICTHISQNKLLCTTGFIFVVPHMEVVLNMSGLDI